MTDFETWGPVFWWVMHCVAANFPPNPTEEQRQDATTWMHKLAPMLPCGTCGTHLRQHLDKNDIYPSTASRELFERYIYNLHEEVNGRNRKAKKHTFEEVQKAFQSGKAWKEFGGYPIKNSPRYTNVDSSQFFSHFNLKGMKDGSVDAEQNLTIPAASSSSPQTSTYNAVLIGLIVVGSILILVVIGFIVYGVLTNKKYGFIKSRYNSQSYIQQSLASISN